MFDNWYFYLPLIVFSLLSVYSIRKNKVNIVQKGKIYTKLNYLPLVIIGLYLISSLLLFLVDIQNWYPNFHQSSYTFTNFFLYTFFITLFLIPALQIQPFSSEKELPQYKSNKKIVILMSIFGWYSFIYQLPYAIKAIKLGANEVRYLLDISQIYILPDSLFTTIAAGISCFYLFYIAFFFISFIQGYNVVIKISMLIGSLSYVMNGLTFSTRDVSIFYIVSFIFVYLLFSRMLENSFKKKVKLYLSVVCISMFLLLMIFSYQRFITNTRDALAYGTIGYISQQPLVFCETIEQQKYFYNGDLRFPVFKSLFYNVNKVQRINQYEWSFGTFVKDFYSEGGYGFLVLSTILLVPFFIYQIKKCKKEFGKNIIILLFYFQFISEGLFYFKLGSRSGNIYILILFVIYLLISINKKTKYAAL